MKAWIGTKREKQIVAMIWKKLGLLVKIEEHVHNVGTCYRCGTTVEPIISKQWFVKMEPLGKACHRGGEKRDDTRFVPERFTKTYISLDGKYSRLVYFPSAVVGTSDSRLLL